MRASTHPSLAGNWKVASTIRQRKGWRCISDVPGAVCDVSIALRRTRDQTQGAARARLWRDSLTRAQERPLPVLQRVRPCIAVLHSKWRSRHHEATRARGSRVLGRWGGVEWSGSRWCITALPLSQDARYPMQRLGGTISPLSTHHFRSGTYGLLEQHRLRRHVRSSSELTAPMRLGQARLQPAHLHVASSRRAFHTKETS